MKIKAFIKKNREKFLEELAEYIEIKSTADNIKAINLITKKIIQKLKDLGTNVNVVKIKNSKPFILAEIGSGNKTLLIYDHYDVMPAKSSEDWIYPPFQLTREKDLLYGRGLADNKGHLVLRLQALESILETVGKLPIKIKFVIEGEEEIGSPHISAFSNKFKSFLKKADLCLWESGDVDEKGRPQMFLGMKGIAYFLLEVQLGKNDLHSGYASIVDSAVWRLVRALNSLRDENGKVLIPELTNNIRKPDSYELALLDNYPLSKTNILKSLGRKSFLANRTKKRDILLNHFYGITCNICGIWSGSTKKDELKTVLPNKAYAKIDFRLVENIDSKKVFSYLRNFLKQKGFKDIKIKEMANLPVAKTDHKNPVFRRAVSIIEKSYGKKVVITPYAKGSGPMYYIASRFNVPAIQLGAQNMASNIHGPNENIKLSDYFSALQATVYLILNL